MNSNTMNSAGAGGLGGYIKTLLISYGLTVILLLGLTFLMYQMKLGAAEASWGVTVIYLLACAVGGFLTGKRVGTRRLLWGLVFGVLYFTVLLILSLIAGGSIQEESRQILTILATCLAGSAVGAFIS